MNTSDGAHIAHKVTAAGSHRQVLSWVQAVSVDHEIAVLLVNRRVLGLVFLVKEFREGFPLSLTVIK